MDPDLIARIVESMLFAQQDQTRVADPREREEPEPQGELQNFLFNLIQGADPTMGLGSSLAGAIPDNPNLKLQIAAGLLTGGSLKGLFKGAASVGKKTVSAADEAFQTLMARIEDRTVGAMKSSRTVNLMDDILARVTGTPSFKATRRDLDDASLLRVVRADRADRAAREGRSVGLELLDSEIVQQTRNNELIERLFDELLNSESIKGVSKPKGR